jgi:hypothetical protein
MKEHIMRPADACGEMLEPDALCGGALTDEDLEGVTGGMLSNTIPGASAAKDDRAASQPFGVGC